MGSSVTSWIIIAGMLLLAVAVWFAARPALKEEKDMTTARFTVREKKVLLWLGVGLVVFVFGSIVLVLVLTLRNNTQTPAGDLLKISAFLFALSLPGFYFIWYWVRKRVAVEGGGGSYRPVFGRERPFAVSDISHARVRNIMGNECLFVYVGGKKLFRVESNCVGYEFLLARLAQEEISID